jgi:hypothetical protein
MIENPDEVVIHQPLICTCGENLAGIAKNIAQKRQMFDLPVIKFNVVEHQIESCDCPRCGKLVVAEFPNNIISKALQNEPPPKLNCNNGKPSKTESRLLLEFFQKSREQVLAFAFDKSMPFSNNLAEQAFRHVKTKMKVIGGFRIIEGAKTYARCQAVMDTWRKRGQSDYENLIIALDVWQLSPKYA